ncbi:glycosaminoglycan xylosylkinase-like isoform X4 [Oppia nitens]|uniref:glycosaminoglycan xylosylkinase-like isoform X4 n=1 Tax=Oppia nitens TaxID=1686743 RepID=UPI0023DCE9CF|nr:glycosaminoglycan xylosylkinase-like isoform X4 [Oppia nitens]
MRLKTRIVSTLLLCCLSLASFVLYFVVFFDDSESKQTPKTTLIILPFSEIRIKNQTKKAISADIVSRIASKADAMSLNVSQEALSLLSKLKSELRVDQTDVDPSRVWTVAQSWVTARAVLPENATLLGLVLSTLSRARVSRADVSRSGTQLKVLLDLEGGQRVLFKPKRYSRDFIVDGIYGGADRHNGEIVAFHVSRLLSLRSAPVVSSRRLHIDSELRSVATPGLSSTFLNDSCFYGDCHFCSPSDAVCCDSSGYLEGSVHLLLPAKFKLQRVRHPWQRTYRSGVSALWETDAEFCDKVLKRVALRPRLLDLIDASILDFLIGNADRHHYEVFKDVPNSAVLLIDNGKSFGNPDFHELSILYPLLQCCHVRRSTVARLRLVAALPLSHAVQYLLSDDALWPLLTREHLSALDVRARRVLAAVEFCLETKGFRHVFAK